MFDLIVKMKFGSHLYGLDTELSDTDYKGVYLPDKKEIFLNRIKKSIDNGVKTSLGARNSKEDVDFEIYSLHYFIKLACEGQTVAIDMLHANKNVIEITSDIWKNIVKNRERFYTKNLQAFVGYARRQAAKYGIKGSRLSDLKRVIEFLDRLMADTVLRDIWSFLPVGEHINTDLRDENTNLRLYQICGKQFHETTKAGYVLPILQKTYNEYGQRAKSAEISEGVDWKAVSHAIRASIQVKQLFEEGTITFPIKNREFLLAVKQGKLNYKTEVAPVLEEMLEEVEILSKNSNLPEKADTEFWDNFIIETIEKYRL